MERVCPKCDSVNVYIDENGVAACESCGYVNYEEVFSTKLNSRMDYFIGEFESEE